MQRTLIQQATQSCSCFCTALQIYRLIQALLLTSPFQTVLQLEIQNLEDALQEKKEALESDLQNCLKLVAEAYDR